VANGRWDHPCGSREAISAERPERGQERPSGSLGQGERKKKRGFNLFHGTYSQKKGIKEGKGKKKVSRPHEREKKRGGEFGG